MMATAPGGPAVNLVERGAWGARDRKGEVPLRLDPLGVKIHYLGQYVDPALILDHSKCGALLRAVQSDHMDNRRWVDLGYTCAVCPHQEVMIGRGPHVLPAANGNGLNAEHYAIVAMVGDSGLTVPPAPMLHGVCDAIDWLRSEGAGGEVKRHCDGYDTTCPGAFLSTWVEAGARRPHTAPLRPPAGVPWPGRVLEFPPLLRGEDVETWQRQMRARGWPVVVDGLFGPESREVARKFQREKGLKASGKVNRSTWEATWRAPVT